MNWDDELTDEQKLAASHTGSPARLLAGPGTGKTRVLTRRIQFLVQQKHVPPQGILALTFTRAAARELRQRLIAALPGPDQPRVSTLHSFALRQLMRNSSRLTTLPQPLRVADDWEERDIIRQDIKAIMGLPKVGDVEKLFHELSSDWESLAADQGPLTPDPRFIGAWQEHRRIFGYSLRSELVYRLKRSLEQVGDFDLEAPTDHLLVDEYQDLNRCDLAVVHALTGKGAELYAAGDDDQSIYGFRKAHPDGIRNFQADYPTAADLRLSECKRCDRDILALGEFIANLDTRRINKVIKPERNRQRGEVAILRFQDNAGEAAGVAQLVQRFIQQDGIPAAEILVLLRVDTRRAFTKPLQQALARVGISCATDATGHGPLDTDEGRQVLAVLRLLVNPLDHLSWRTLLMRRNNNVGPTALTALYDYARDGGQTFASVLTAVEGSPTILPRFGTRVSIAVGEIRAVLNRLSPFLAAESNSETIPELVGQAIQLTVGHSAPSIVAACVKLALETHASSVHEFLFSLDARNADIDPEVEEGKVEILTMHKAKGLEARAVVIAAAEDEHIPGRQNAEPSLGDERRLLYVSMTRAKHTLIITYCDCRRGQQSKLGRAPGNPTRKLTTFLQDAAVRPESGDKYNCARANLPPQVAS